MYSFVTKMKKRIWKKLHEIDRDHEVLVLKYEKLEDFILDIFLAIYHGEDELKEAYVSMQE